MNTEKIGKEKEPFDRIEEIVNWTLPGLTMYYRDSNLSKKVIEKYKKGKIFRSATFVDVSNFAGKPITNCRFIFASSKAAPLFKVNPDTEKWGLHAINCNSYFKVLDVYEKEDITQVFILHIPYKGIDLFSRSVLQLGEQNVEEQIIGKARESLDHKLELEIPVSLNEEEWIKRTSFPIGLDKNDKFFSLEPTEPLIPMVLPLSSAIRKMTNDLSDLNKTPIPQGKPDKVTRNKTQERGSQKKVNKKRSGFWSNLFGKN